MVDENALHITPEQAANFGERREVLRESEAKALREQAASAQQLQGQLETLRQQLSAQTGSLLVQDGTLIVHDFQLTPTGLIAPEGVTQESWASLGRLLFRLEGSIQWLIGDWVVYGETMRYGDMTKLAEEMGYVPGTIWSYASVCRSIKTLIRIKDLSFAHHRLVTSLTPEQQAFALDYAAAHKLSVSKFREWISEQQGQSDNIPALPVAFRFKTIGGEMDKFMDRDPSTAKPSERETALSYAAQMETWLDAYKKKWGGAYQGGDDNA